MQIASAAAISNVSKMYIGHSFVNKYPSSASSQSKIGQRQATIVHTTHNILSNTKQVAHCNKSTSSVQCKQSLLPIEYLKLSFRLLDPLSSKVEERCND
jgi:hypothetical protein